MSGAARRWRALLPLFFCSACVLFAPPDRFGARPVSFAELPGWADDDHAAALETFLATCPVFAKKARPPASGSGLQIPEPVWQSLCAEAGWAKGNAAQARFFFENRFAPYRVNNNGNERGLFTGYYEPMLYGSLTPHGDFLYPLYAPPPELEKSKPYAARAEIDGGALKGRRLEIAWVDDPVMLFFLHIQGSGRLRLPDGSEMQVGYAGANGQSYVSLGKVMIDEGLLQKEDVNFFTLRQWLYQHREQAFAMMARNPSYVFFKKLDRPGAVGAAGVVLTPQRSLAVDSKYIPYGLPLYLETELPPMPQQRPVPFRRLMVAQDTGGAIRGPVRGDVFFGPGDEAEYYAGYMKGKGSYTLLVPKEAVFLLNDR